MIELPLAVFVVTAWADCEGPEILGVYSCRLKAEGAVLASVLERCLGEEDVARTYERMDDHWRLHGNYNWALQAFEVA